MSTIITISLLASLVSAEQYQNDATEQYLAQLNKSLSENYLYALLALTGLVFIYRNAVRLYAHARHLASMNNAGAQKYFSIGSPIMGWLKDHLLYAPTFEHKRATEIRIHRHINFGTIPTRFQTIFITAVIVYNVFACTWNIPWNDPQLQVLPVLRNRTGTLSTANLIPIVVMATIKNPMINVLDISYDTYNLMHRWLGRLSILQGIAHSIAYTIGKVEKGGWASMKVSVSHAFIYNGLIATIGFTILFLHAPKLVRSWSYEIFLHIHFVVAILTFAFLWMHLNGFPQQMLLLGAIVIWAGARLWRFLTVVYRSFGKQSCVAQIEAMPGDALRISLTSPRPWTFHAGQSVYLTIPSVGWWTAHPFSIAWTDFGDNLVRSDSVKSTFDEKNPIIRKHIPAEQRGKQHYSLIVKAKSGMTKKLLDRVERAGGVEGVQISFNACIEGPYGTERSMASYGTVMLFASGVGITHQIPYVKELLEGYADGTVSTRRITLVWVIPSTDCLEWIRSWMHDILGMKGRRDVLRVVLYITRAGLSVPIRSPSETVRMLRGRPDVAAMMQKEAAEKVGCMGVSVCAGGGLADEVRRVSRVLCATGVNLNFEEQGFGW